MTPVRRKLGILISAGPDTGNFRHGIETAAAALRLDVDVYLYCIDDAVTGLADERLQRVRSHGAKLYACAFGLQRRQLPRLDVALFAGLSMLHELIAHTDKFIAFS